MELKATRVHVADHVAEVRLHRPHRHNAWTGRMHAEYRWIMAQLSRDPDVRVVVLTGEPPAFCVGGDADALAGHAVRGEYDPGLPPEPAQPVPDVPAALDHDFAWHFAFRVPIVAAVNGACAGIGLALAAFCDLRYVSATAKVTTAAPRLGLPAEYGLSWILPRLVGVTRAADLLLTGRTVTGRESADWGLWNGVAEDGDGALALAHETARLIASTVGPTAARVTKRQLYDDLRDHGVGASIDTSMRLLREAMRTDEYTEGVSALRERRAPRFEA
jgi:enoyl-CoA hydratase/carnithine racemase